jgi:hypothetical protein
MASTTNEGAGLVLACGGGSAWDAGAVSNPVVRVFPGKEASKWFMWYTGRAEPSSRTDAVLPAAGKVGAPELLRATSGKCRELAPLR